MPGAAQSRLLPRNLRLLYRALVMRGFAKFSAFNRAWKSNDAWRSSMLVNSLPLPGLKETRPRQVNEHTTSGFRFVRSRTRALALAVFILALVACKSGPGSDINRRLSETNPNAALDTAKIIERFQALTPRFATLNQGVQSQSLSAGRISESIGQLGAVAQQIADSLHETDSDIARLNEAIQALREEVARFKVRAERAGEERDS